MRRGLPSVILVILPVLTVMGCSADDGAQAAEPAVPAGVATQYASLEEEIGEAGGDTTVGPWRVGYIIEAAEPWYEGRNGSQVFREPAPGETNHIEILPIEAKTGRVVPDVPIRLEVLDDAGAVVDAQELNFYYSTFFHYANNFHVSQPGTYTLRVTLGVPGFFRHGEAGVTPPLSEGATAIFTGVEITPGG